MAELRCLTRADDVMASARLTATAAADPIAAKAEGGPRGGWAAAAAAAVLVAGLATFVAGAVDGPNTSPGTTAVQASGL